MPPIAPPHWTPAQLKTFIADAEEVFRSNRMIEPLEAYLTVFDLYRDHFETLLESTLDRVVWTSGNPVSLDAFKDPKLAECIAGYTLRPGLGLYVSVLPVGAAGRLSVVATGVRY